MNTQAENKRIYLCSTFYDTAKIFKFIWLNEDAEILVKGYETHFNTYHQVYKVIKLPHNNSYEIYSVHLGLLHYNTMLPEGMRINIIEHKQSRKLFEYIHTVFFFQYVFALNLKYEFKYWSMLLMHTVDTSVLKSNFSFADLNRHKSTQNLKTQEIQENVASMLNLDPSKISLSKNHIFKFIKNKIYTLGEFVLQRHTIGNHYYTSMCLFVELTVTSAEYNYLLLKLDSFKAQILLTAPEFNVVIVARIQDSDNLNFVLGSAALSLSTWLQSYKNENVVLENYIF